MERPPFSVLEDGAVDRPLGIVPLCPASMTGSSRKLFAVLPPVHAKESAAPGDLTSLRPVRRYVIVPEVVTYSAASSAGERASNISRPHISWGRGSVMPVCRIWSFTVLPSARAKVSSTSRHYISCGRGSAMPSCRIWSPTVLPSARAKEPAATEDPTSFAADAAPCRRAGYGHLQCCHQHGRMSQQQQQTLPLLRQMQRHAVAPDVVTCSAASSAGERASSTSRPHLSCGRCSAMPPGWIWPPTVLPAARAKVPAAPQCHAGRAMAYALTQRPATRM